MAEGGISCGHVLQDFQNMACGVFQYGEEKLEGHENLE